MPAAAGCIGRVGVQRVRRSEAWDCRDGENELVDWTGRQTRPDKRRQVPAELSPILRRLRLSPETWAEAGLNFGRWFCLAAGRVDNGTIRGTCTLDLKDFDAFRGVRSFCVHMIQSLPPHSTTRFARNSLSEKHLGPVAFHRTRLSSFRPGPRVR